jgi:hypothetical protein
MLHKDYDRKGSVAKKKSLVMSLKGLGAKMKSLAVNRQSKVTLIFTLTLTVFEQHKRLNLGGQAYERSSY